MYQVSCIVPGVKLRLLPQVRQLMRQYAAKGCHITRINLDGDEGFHLQVNAMPVNAEGLLTDLGRLNLEAWKTPIQGHTFFQRYNGGTAKSATAGR